MKTRLTLVLLLTGCASAPTIPKVNTVVVETYKPLPAWATDPLAKPAPGSDAVGDHLQSEDARGAVIDYANCTRALLKRLDAGQPVTPSDCKAQH